MLSSEEPICSFCRGVVIIDESPHARHARTGVRILEWWCSENCWEAGLAVHALERYDNFGELVHGAGMRSGGA